MADFEVSVRSSYRDIARMVLDCSPYDFELTSSRRVKRWINRAPAAVVPGGPRFGDPTQSSNALRPAVSEDGGVRFRRSSTESLLTQLTSNFGAASQRWTFAFEFNKGEDATDPQVIFSADNNDLLVWRRNSGNYGYSATAFVPGVGDIPDGQHMLAFSGAGSAAWLHNNAVTIAAGAASNIAFSTGNSLWLGRRQSGSYLDGVLRSLRMWNRVLSSKERSFAFQSLAAADYSALTPDPRARVAVRAWGDGTGLLEQRQSSRVNPDHGQQQSFRLAQIPVGASAAIVQVACETDGTVLPDTSLAGSLYTLRHIERSSASVPVVSQDPGWSSVFDLRFSDPGHYTVLMEREGHGSMYVHMDVEQVG